MSVLLKDGSIILTGDCGVEEAEMLVGLIQGNPGALVNVGEAGAVHTALWQALLALAPEVTGEPRDPFIRRWIAPRLGLAADRAAT